PARAALPQEGRAGGRGAAARVDHVRYVRIPIRCVALISFYFTQGPVMVDRLAILLERFAVTASVFHAGALCGINSLAGEDDAGQLHLVRRGPLQVSHGQQTVQVEVPSL